MNVLERADEGIAHEQLRLEQQLEQQKREWELDRQRAVRNNQQMMADSNRDLEDEPLMVAPNQVNTSSDSNQETSDEESSSGEDSSTESSNEASSDSEETADRISHSVSVRSQKKVSNDKRTHHDSHCEMRASKNGEETPRTRSRGQVHIDLWTLDEREKSLGKESDEQTSDSILANDALGTTIVEQDEDRECNESNKDGRRNLQNVHEDGSSPEINERNATNNARNCTNLDVAKNRIEGATTEVALDCNSTEVIEDGPRLHDKTSSICEHETRILEESAVDEKHLLDSTGSNGSLTKRSAETNGNVTNRVSIKDAVGTKKSSKLTVISTKSKEKSRMVGSVEKSCSIEEFAGEKILDGHANEAALSLPNGDDSVVR